MTTAPMSAERNVPVANATRTTAIAPNTTSLFGIRRVVTSVDVATAKTVSAMTAPGFTSAATPAHAARTAAAPSTNGWTDFWPHERRSRPPQKGSRTGRGECGSPSRSGLAPLLSQPSSESQPKGLDGGQTSQTPNTKRINAEAGGGRKHQAPSSWARHRATPSLSTSDEVWLGTCR